MESENHNHECGCCNHDNHGINYTILENSRKYEETWVPVPKVCAQCGKEYLPSDYRHQSARYKFCSKVCQRKFHALERSKHFSATRTCVVCGKVFTTKNLNKKTCSSECSKINRYRSAHKEIGTVKYDRKCPVCGTEFTTNIQNKKFCCNVCKRKFFYSKHRKETFTRKCVVCGTEFKTSNTTRKTCSEACSKENSNRKKMFSSYKGRVMKEFEVIGSVKSPIIKKSEVFHKTCPVCGKEFETNVKNKVFCCLVCKKTTERINHRKTHSVIAFHKTCPTCGKEFETNVKSKVFCCHACKKTAERINYRKTHSVIAFHKTCPACGKEFETVNHFKVYCSKECKLSKAEESGIKNLVAIEPRACIVCGKMFTPDTRHKKQKTCSKECRRIHDNMYKRQCYKRRDVESRICQWCEKEFIPHKTHPNAKYCSKECRRYHKYPVLKKKCVECGKEFETFKKRVVCCSKECSRKYRLKGGKTALKYNVGDIVTSKCVYCGKEFSYSYIKGATRKYCSVECRRREWKEKHPLSTSIPIDEWNMTEGTCVHCGTKFRYKLKAKEKIYCSNKCISSEWFSRHPGYHPKNKKCLSEESKRKKLEERMLKRQRCIEEAEAKRRYRLEHAEEFARIRAERTARMDKIRRETAAKRRKAAKEKQRNHLKHVLQRARAKGLTILYAECLECGSEFGYVKEWRKDGSVPDFCCDSCKNHWEWEHGLKQHDQKKKSCSSVGNGKISVLTTKRYNPDGSITVTKKRVSNLSYGIGGLRYDDLGDVVETDSMNLIDEEVGKMFDI